MRSSWDQLICQLHGAAAATFYPTLRRAVRKSAVCLSDFLLDCVEVQAVPQVQRLVKLNIYLECFDMSAVHIHSSIIPMITARAC